MTPAEDARESPQEIADRCLWERREDGRTWWFGSLEVSEHIAAAIEAERRDADERERKAAAQARREALEEAAKKATSFLVGDPRNGVPLRNPMAHEIAAAIRALIDAPAPAKRRSAEIARAALAGLCPGRPQDSPEDERENG
jgi:MoxR-like ATPase